MTTTTAFQISTPKNVRASLCVMVMAWHLVTPCGAQCEFTGTILDAETNHALPARVYLQRQSDQRWLFVQSTADEGSALPYAEQWVPMPRSVERHTTVSAHPFKTTLEPGDYTITIERGKEGITVSWPAVVPEATLEISEDLATWKEPGQFLDLGNRRYFVPHAERPAARYFRLRYQREME